MAMVTAPTGLNQTVTNGNAAVDPNYNVGFSTNCNVVTLYSNPAFSDTDCFDITQNLYAGQELYGGGTNAKETAIVQQLTLNAYGGAQTFDQVLTMNCFSNYTDCFNQGFKLSYYGGPEAGNEGIGFSPDSNIQQATQGRRLRNVVSQAAATCNTAIVIPGYGQTATLAANVDGSTQTFTVTGGSAFQNGDLVKVDTEYVYLASGAGTGTWTVYRNQYASAYAASHSLGATLTRTGVLTAAGYGQVAILASAITAGATTITVLGGSDSAFVNGNWAQLDSEYVLITSGAGTGTWTVTRGQLTPAGGPAAPHQANTSAPRVQSVTVNSATGGNACHAGDWVVVNQSVDTGYPNIEAVQLIAAPDATHIVGIFRTNQPGGTTITPAQVLTLDGTQYFGQYGVLVDIDAGTAVYDTGVINTIGTYPNHFTCSGCTWTNSMVGGSALNIGAIALTADDQTTSPWGTGTNALKSWYQITGLPNSTTMTIHSITLSGDLSYRGNGYAALPAAAYTIHPAGRILAIPYGTNTVVLESGSFTWTGQVEETVTPYPDVTMFLWNAGGYTPGGMYRSFIQLRNTGTQQFGNAIDIEQGNLFGLGGGASATAFANTIYNNALYSGALIYDVTQSPGNFSTREVFPAGNKCDEWYSSNGSGAASMGLDYATGNWFLAPGVCAPANALSFVLPAGGPAVVTWRNAANGGTGTVAMLADIETPGKITRTIPAAVGDEVDIGSFNTSSSPYGGTYQVELVAFDGSSGGITKTWVFTPPIVGGTGGWVIVPPLYSSTQVSDVALDVSAVQGNSVSARLRKVAGSSSFTAYLNVQQTVGNGAFTASTATSTVTPPTTYLQGLTLGANVTGSTSYATPTFTNCPATDCANPYTWMQVTTADGSTGYMPVFK